MGKACSSDKSRLTKGIKHAESMHLCVIESHRRQKRGIHREMARNIREIDKVKIQKHSGDGERRGREKERAIENV